MPGKISEEVGLVDYDKNAEDILIAKILYPHSRLSVSEILQKVKLADGTNSVFHINIFPIDGVSSKKMLGGHAVLGVGFDQKAKRIVASNSWGTGWGMDGYFTMPFEYLLTLADDFWTIRK